MKASLLVMACFALSGCGSDAATRFDPSPQPQPDSGSAGSGGAVMDAAKPKDVAVETDAALGIVAIDVQEAFVSTASNPDLETILDHAKSTFQLATERQVPFFITFEGSQDGDHALHAPLQAVLPPQAKTFIKTTFDATGLVAFAEALEAAKLSHLVVLGSETDVCVLQTVLGLRKMGFTVLLEQDAVFTEETNTSPARRRMQQAGALLVNQTDLAGYAASPSTLPAGKSAPVTVAKPLQLGIVLNDFTDASLTATVDPLVSQKSARLRELLLVSAWFDLPVYATDPSLALPSSFATYYTGAIHPASQLASDTSVEQLVFAGTDAGLADVISAWQGRATFVMEDALLARDTAAAQKQMLQPFFDAGLVPITYKSFYYEMTHSISLAEWPSQAWVQKFDEYFWITQAPEDLPPITGD